MARNSQTRSGRESFWRRIVEGERSSGLSVRAWCSQNDVRESAFYWWRRELARRDGKTALVPVRITVDGPDVRSATASSNPIEIILPHQRSVRITGPIDRQALIDVIAVLTSTDIETAEC